MRISDWSSDVCSSDLLIRSLFNSKTGLAITFGFIALIALAFGIGDVAGTGTFGGVAGGDRVAVVGDEKIGNAEFSRSVTSAIDQVRQDKDRKSTRLNSSH